MTKHPGTRAALRTWLGFALLLIAASAGAFFAGTRLVVTRPTHPLTGRVIPAIASDAAWMDRADRMREEAPERALDLLEITSGMAVADIGAGTGYLTVRIARRVGPTGKVFANDLQPPMLRMIRQKARQEGLENVETIQGTSDDTRIPPDAVDLALLVDVYHELQNPHAMLQSIRWALHSNGRLAVIEYRKEGTARPDIGSHRMSAEDLRSEVEPEGFRVEHIDETLPRQHIVVFRKSTQ